MDRIVVRKRRVHVAETSTNAKVCADNINVACEYCGKIVKINNQLNVNRAMSGHLTHCKSSTKRIRLNTNENPIKTSQDMDNFNEDQNDGLDEVHDEVVIIPSEIKQVDIAANPSISFQLEIIKCTLTKKSSLLPFVIDRVLYRMSAGRHMFSSMVLFRTHNFQNLRGINYSL